MTQHEALEILKMGRNVFITGAAGSGKTYLLNEYIKYLRAIGADAGITASTGIAATHMNGMTIHAWSGLGIKDQIGSRELSDLSDKRYLRKRIEAAKVLIIDEISMLHHFRLDLIDKILRMFKKNSLPFGGMQVVLCGDFFQLPPVSRSGEPESKFAYHSGAWQKLALKICYLEEQHRQSDQKLLEILNAIRDNKTSAEILSHLKSRFGKKPETDVEPAKLHTHNIDVDRENEKELAKLSGRLCEYGMSSRGRENLAEILKRGCLAPERLRLKLGARVMFVKNNFEKNYVNGTLGIVAYCDDYKIRVKTSGGQMIDVEQDSWQIDDGGRMLAEITQYPLRLAWAITVHKSQGMSLDAAEIDLSKSFERGMGYVALSRVRTLGGLSLIGLNDNALLVHPEVLEFDKRFRAESAGHAKELAALRAEEIAREKEEFYGAVADSAKIKLKKPDTFEETKKYLAQKKSLKEIAEARGLTYGTIVSHLEKFKERKSAVDFSYVKSEIPPERFAKIRSAFIKVAGKDGKMPMSPARQILGDDFSFEEIRLARLFI